MTLVLGNPPYIRYQYLQEKQRECQAQIFEISWNEVEQTNKCMGCVYGSMYSASFRKRKIAFVIPAEILQVAYAEDLRLYLADNLAKITLITF